MAEPMKYVKLSDFLTDEQIQAAWDLYEWCESNVQSIGAGKGFATIVEKEIIEPNISVIQLKLKQQCDSRYLAHAVQYAFDTVSRRK